jgi:hypothetical protein
MANSLAESVKESFICVTLAVRDGIQPPISLISALIWIGTIVLWGAAFYFLHTPLAQALSGLHSVLRFIMIALLYVTAVVVTVRIAIELWLMKLIQLACLKHYPGLSLNQKGWLLLGLREAPKTAGLFIFGGIASLLMPGIGPALLFMLIGYLNVRSLMNDGMDGMVTEEERRTIIESSRISMLLIGTALSALFLLPIVGLFAPSILGTSVCHLCMRQTIKLRATTDQNHSI